MNFIQFGNQILNLDQVVRFRLIGIDASGFIGDIEHCIQAVTVSGAFVEAHPSLESAEKRFKELSDYLVEQKHLYTKSEVLG